MIRVLDLCCGSQSVKKALLSLYGPDRVEVTCVDSDWKCQPDIHADIRNLEHARIWPRGHFDIVWASPPCTEYSRAKTRGIRDLEAADSIVKKCLEIIDHLEPRWWFLENPATGMLKTREFMAPLWPFYNEVTYCKYGRPYKKPTAVWTNRTGLSLKHCTTEPCEYKRANGIHESCAQGGPAPGFLRTARREITYQIPEPLLRVLLGGFRNEHEVPGPIADEVGSGD